MVVNVFQLQTLKYTAACSATVYGIKCTMHRLVVAKHVPDLLSANPDTATCQ